ncbi:MAG TPA: RDD family protein [Candidatus Angelobacter sp.]|jgi:uncharacterized RDD family membrane protein YckC
MAQSCQNCGLTLSSSLAPSQAAAPARAYAQPPVVYAPAVSSAYAGFWIRVVAFILDRIVIGVAAAPFYFVLVLPSLLRIIHEAENNGEPSPEMIFSIIGGASVFLVLVFVGYWLYEALLTASSWQGTIGKRVLRLKVTDEAGNRISFGRSTGRFFAKILSYVTLWIGFIMVAFTDKKRGLHDILAGTVVVRY